MRSQTIRFGRLLRKTITNCRLFILVIALLWLMLLSARLSAQNKGDSDNGIFPLMNAAWLGKVEQAKQLLRQKAIVDATDKQGITALMWTATWTTYDVIMGGYEEQHIDVARLLLDAGADINKQDNAGKTALIYAVAWDHTKLARALLVRGANVNLRDKQGRSALTYAAWQSTGQDTLTSLLLANGTRMNSVEALLLNNIPQARQLIEKRQGVHALVPHGETALMLAARQGDITLVRLLLVQGVDVNAQDERGFTALMLAGGATPYHSNSGRKGWQEFGKGSAQEREAILQLLLTHKAQVNERDKDGTTALMWSVERGEEGMAHLLIKSGAGVNLKNKSGDSILQQAHQQNNPAIIALLKDAGAREP